MRTKLGALLGAGGLLLLAASATMAAPPTYGISVSKTASPASVGSGGGTVAFTVWVTGTGTGFFQTVNVTDPLAGCTLGAKVVTSGDSDDKLEEGETWSFSCTVNGVTPGTQNTATVNACHDISACNNAGHDAQGQGSVTVTDDGSTAAPPTATPGAPTATPAAPTDTPAPPTATPAAPTDTPDPGQPSPTQDEAGLTEAPTDMAGGIVTTMGSQRTLMLVLSLGMLLASLILITPTRPVRARNPKR